MKKIALWLSLLAASLAPAYAQVTVEVVFQQDQFLPGEALPAAVRITNRSGQLLRLGGEAGWLTFSVESRDGVVVPKLGDLPATGEFTLESSQVATKRVDLAPYFSFGEVGRYAVTATVRIKAWEREITSSSKVFYIIEGAKLWEQEFGVPRSLWRTNTTPEVRKYILQQANYLKGQLRLYLRLTEAAGEKPLRVFPIGPMVSFGRPEPLVDRASNLHVLYQSGAHLFSYLTFSPEGEVLTRQTYDYVRTRPRLRLDMEGKVGVVGGLRRVMPDDLPAQESSESTNRVPPSAEAGSAPPPEGP